VSAASSPKVPSPKVPATPPAKLKLDKAHVMELREGTWLWRVGFTASAHPLGWNKLRHYGPVPQQRFDPHPLPLGQHTDAGVMYTAQTPRTALAEVYQDDRVIDRFEDAPQLTGWKVTRDLQLVNLTTNWPIVNQGAASMQMDDKTNTQPWARAIEAQLGGRVDGLFHLSSMTGEPLVTLFTRVETVNVFPPHPGYSKLLSDPGAKSMIRQAVKFAGYGIV